MNSKQIRQEFLQFFKNKEHAIVPSAPMVNHDDPTLMFTNAGMNQFKDFFLGDKVPNSRRVADTQKCLRVSGKHNDLEEVGIDSYHHTMFEMLGNWSFGNYFKKEAVAWAWEFLIDKMKLDPTRLYATVFEGDDEDNLGADKDAADIWKQYLPEERILYAGKKDNFWEMGETGPCGPCSEIHIDIRPESERQKVPGADLVNKDHPLVIEIWNLVFIQYNRLANRSLSELPDKHIDTGMGFERLCMVSQGKTSNYETDVFSGLIQYIEELTGIKYTNSYDLQAKTDISMRVIADHIRAVSFAIADGQLPSNTGAGYVIRRILRRAIRYNYSFLGVSDPMIYKLVSKLVDYFDDVFPELKSQSDFIQKVILEEEKSFLRTLADGLKKLDALGGQGKIDGKSAFELYDTYGFPFDLTTLIASEKGWNVDEQGFHIALEEQKKRSRADAKMVAGDWVAVRGGTDSAFVGYDQLESDGLHVVKYRTIWLKDKPQYQIVLDSTPFYAEGGGQVGDTGMLFFGEQPIKVLNTVKENNLPIHIVNKLPENFELPIKAVVNKNRRQLIENNHTATHLMHAALKEVLGDHVAQKGSLVNEKHLRFDFSHFQKLSTEELQQVEQMVNQKIRQNIAKGENRSISLQKAKESGATMLFGEKYGDHVRMITFDPAYSIELCGGCHVEATGELGFFKIKSESAVAAGVRRIEAVTSDQAEAYIHEELNELEAIRSLFKNPLNTAKNVNQIVEENKLLKKKIDSMVADQAGHLKSQLKDKFEEHNGVNVLAEVIDMEDSKAIKTLAYNLEKEVGNAFIALGFQSKSKPQLMLLISQDLADGSGLDAGKIIREISKSIKGGGGGQSHFATAGGSDASGLADAVSKAKSFV